MSVDWAKVAKEHWDAQPHPKGHGLTIGEYATAVKLATLLKFGGHASGAEAALFYPEFKATGMSPQEFEHAVERISPLSFTYHGRPPTMHEIVSLKDKQPHEVRKYFGDLPDRHYPHIGAADMIKSLEAAKPHAQEHLGRDPVKYEAQYLHHSGERPQDYYQRLGEQTKIASSPDVQTQERRGRVGRGDGAPGRPQTSQ